MKAAKNRVVANLILAMIALGASISAAVTRPGGWLVLLAFIVGFICAWLVFGSIVAYGQQRTKAKLLDAMQRKRNAAALAALLKNQPTKPESESS